MLYSTYFIARKCSTELLHLLYNAETDSTSQGWSNPISWIIYCWQVDILQQVLFRIIFALHFQLVIYFNSLLE